MKFHQLKTGDRFKFNNQEYVKINEVIKSCCKVLHNCQTVSDSQKKALRPMDEVEKLG